MNQSAVMEEHKKMDDGRPFATEEEIADFFKRKQEAREKAKMLSRRRAQTRCLEEAFCEKKKVVVMKITEIEPRLDTSQPCTSQGSPSHSISV